MTKKSKEHPKPESKASGELLEQFQKTLPASKTMSGEMPAISDREEEAAIAAKVDFDDLDHKQRQRHIFKWLQRMLVWHAEMPTPKTDDDDVVQTWNEMAAAMVGVIKTIKVNEAKSTASEKRFKHMMYIVICTVLAAFCVNWFQGDNISQNSDLHNAAIEDKLDTSAGKQDALLTAVIALAIAQGVGLEADADYNPEKDALARIEALAAQKAAFEAKKTFETDPAEKAKTDAKIKRVDRAAQKAKDEAKEEAELPKHDEPPEE